MSFYKKLVISTVICLGGGWLSGLVTKPGLANWYNHLHQPLGTPPDYLFPVVWTTLYLLMAISLALFWSSPLINKTKAAVFFTLQLALNFCWSWIFFILRNPLAALIDLVLMYVFLVLTIIYFKKFSRISAYLLIPYLCWLTYALYLNLFIWLLNK